MTAPPTTRADRLPEPVWATPVWRAAVHAAHGMCQCAGLCGRKHAASGGQCDQYQGLNGLNLSLTEDGQVYCPRCFTAIARAFAQAAATAKASAAAERYPQDDLLALLDDQD